jgi:predicted Zn-dependent peptidase
MARLLRAALGAALALTLVIGEPPQSLGAQPDADVFRETLPNGMRALVKERPGTEVIAISVGIRGGSRDEDAETVGAAHFMEHMFFQGTPRRPDAASLGREVEALGGWTNAWTGWESINFQVVTPREGLDVALDVISDQMVNSVFAEDKIDKERRVVLEELNGRLNAPAQRAADLFFVEVFGDHPARNLPIGNRETVNAANRDVLLKFRDTYFVAANMAVAVVGDVDHRAVFPKLAAAFSEMRTGPVPAPKVAPVPPPVSRRVVAQSPGQQARVLFGGPVAGSNSEDRYALEVADAILGGAGRRLRSEIQDKRSLASSVGSFYSELTDVGLWAVDVGTQAGNVDQVVELIRAELRRLRDAPPPAADLDEAKAYIRGNYLLDRERSVDLAEELADGTVLGYYEPIEVYLAKIDAVTAEDVQHVARAYLDPENYTLTVLRP